MQVEAAEFVESVGLIATRIGGQGAGQRLRELYRVVIAVYLMVAPAEVLSLITVHVAPDEAPDPAGLRLAKLNVCQG